MHTQSPTIGDIYRAVTGHFAANAHEFQLDRLRSAQYLRSVCVVNTRTDQQAIRAAARAAFLARFEQQVDPEGRLTVSERRRRAERASRDHFRSLTYRRHQAA